MINDASNYASNFVHTNWTERKGLVSFCKQSTYDYLPIYNSYFSRISSWFLRNGYNIYNSETPLWNLVTFPPNSALVASVNLSENLYLRRDIDTTLKDVCSILNRGQLISEAVIQVFLTISLYRLYLLLLDVGRRKITETPSLILKVGPCCCWPCLPFPSLEMTDANLSWLGILALQLPIVQVKNPFPH